jgi:molybdopterin-containing oxidoreductase family iron-sulfur binding subunit
MSKRKPTAPIETDQWRSVEEHDDPAAAQESLAREFPDGASELDGSTRREFMQLVGGTLALAGVGTMAGCKDPPERVRPYNVNPADVIPGRPLHYATMLNHGGYATAVLATAWEGRPTKIEGNPDHPLGKGATTSFDQATILSLYDDTRAKELKHHGSGQSWRQFCLAMEAHAAGLKADGGSKLAFLVEPSGSPLLASLQKRIAAAFPKARWYAHSAVSRDAAYEGSRTAFGRPLETQYNLSKAKVVVSLDADFLGGWPEWMPQQLQWAERRAPGPDMSRLYVAEAMLTNTGMMADHRLRARSSDLGKIAAALHAAVAGGNADAGDAKANAWVKAVAKDLTSAGGDAVVVVGGRLEPAVHALVHAINATLTSNAVSYTAPVLPAYEPLSALSAEIKAGHVDTLVITAWNPVYSTTGDVGFAQLLAKVPNAIYHAYHEDDTASEVAWIIPRAHDLESWGDGRSTDGTVTLQQPIIQPLFNGVSVAELWSAFLGEGGKGGYNLLRAGYANLDDAAFEKAVQKGIVDGTGLAKETSALQSGAVTGAADKLGAAAGGLEVNFVPDHKLLDGRWANNVWLQELPDPVTKLTWDNAIVISPATGRKLDLKTSDRATLKTKGGSITAQVLVQPGHADDSATIAIGYGRNVGAEVHARGCGVNVLPIMAAGRWYDAGASLQKVDHGPKLAITQEHWNQEARPIALEVANRAILARGPKLPILNQKGDIEDIKGHTESMYRDHVYTGFQWAMGIDLNRCTGCSACVTACVAENNIPVVGREGVKRSREMHWIRLDVYFQGSADEPSTIQPQPMMCVHCEKAPCEYVCPVNATVHSDEGLNEMAYNRCIGTRYCSNNCPYKVRRFNFLDYHPSVQNIARMAMNPDVTVRSRGVMEKCTYCVQRIERARIDARVAGRELADGEFTTACAQACPSKAIVFGSLHDKETAVSKWHEDPRAYDVLHELGTRPRTAHLARVKNKNPELTNG